MTSTLPRRRRRRRHGGKVQQFSTRWVAAYYVAVQCSIEPVNRTYICFRTRTLRVSDTGLQLAKFLDLIEVPGLKTLFTLLI